MGAVILFGLLGFVLELFALSYVKNKLYRWFPIIFLEGFLMGMMINRRINPPPSTIVLGWQIYQWLMAAAAVGAVLAWQYVRKHRR